jgi:hypothetical protein
MANTFIQIGSTVTVGSGGAVNIEFTSIPATYTDLIILTSLRSTRTPSTDGSHTALTFNNNTSNIYSFTHIRGTGSVASSYNESNEASMNFYSQANSSADTASTFSNNSFYIPNYSGSGNKAVTVDSVYENNATTAGIHIVRGLWANTAAITSIKLAEATGNAWAQYTTAALYGIKNS